eukprot:6490473-Amphidinium_carterae.3
MPSLGTRDGLPLESGRRNRAVGVSILAVSTFDNYMYLEVASEIVLKSASLSLGCAEQGCGEALAELSEMLEHWVLLRWMQ